MGEAGAAAVADTVREALAVASCRPASLSPPAGVSGADSRIRVFGAPRRAGAAAEEFQTFA